MNNDNFLDISWATILKIAVASVCFYSLYLLRDFLILFAFALVISILFEPAIQWLMRRRLPRTLSVVFIYVLIFSALSVILYLTLPNFISEIQYFSEYFPQCFPEYFSKISPFLEKMGFESFANLEVFLTSFQETLQTMTGNIFSAVFVMFGGIFNALFITVIAIFISLERKEVEKGLLLLFPRKYEDYLLQAWRKSQKKITGWFFIRLIGCVFVGLSSYFAFSLLDVQYPFSLALMAGILDFVPIIGPFFAGLIAFMLVSMDSFLKAAFMITAFTLIQGIENGLLLPILSKRIIQVSPLVVLFALFVGGKFWGVMGAILIVPLAAILIDFLKDFLEKHKEEEEVEEEAQEIARE
jgi:predicted PurR-regulated permease PerM